MEGRNGVRVLRRGGGQEGAPLCSQNQCSIPIVSKREVMSSLEKFWGKGQKVGFFVSITLGGAGERWVVA